MWIAEHWDKMQAAVTEGWNKFSDWLSSNSDKVEDAADKAKGAADKVADAAKKGADTCQSAGGGQVPPPDAVIAGGQEWFNKATDEQLRAVVNQHTEDFRKIFGSAVEGAKEKLADLVTGRMRAPEGLTREALEAYREIGRRQIENGTVAPDSIQWWRIQIIDHILGCK